MAKLASIGTGNWLTAGTWGLIDATSYANSEAAILGCITTYTSTCRSAQTTPGAIVVSHIGVKLAVRQGTTGTMTVHIADSSHVEIAGTAVTINTADFPAAASGDSNGGWHFFKLATPVTLLAATLYEVEAKTSSTNQISVYGSAAKGMSCALITTTTQAPVAGDDLFIQGEYTGAGTSNSFTVTMNETATTDYGSASTSLGAPALAISNKGTLTWGVAASTNYNLKISGNIVVYSGGTYNQGGSGAECPRTSSMTLLMDCVSNVDFGIVFRALSIVNGYGLSRTSGKNIVTTKLNADAAANATSLTVVDDTAWLSGDLIAVASTTRTIGDCEQGALNGNAGASTLTVNSFAGTGGGLAVAHSGTSPTQAEIILLTRNVLITGVSTSVQTYIVFENTAIVNFSWVCFRYMGSNTTNKRGLNINTTTGSCTLTYCSFINWEVTGSSMLTAASSSFNNFTFTNNVTWRIADAHLNYGTAFTGTSIIVTDNVFMRCITNTTMIAINDVGGTFVRNTIIGSAGTGIAISEGTAEIGTFTDITCHSNSGSGMTIGAATAPFGTISNVTIWRNNAAGLVISSGEITINGSTFFGNNSGSIGIGQGCPNLTLINIVSNGDSTFASSAGIFYTLTVTGLILKIISGDFGTVSGIKTAHTNDISVATAGVCFIKLENTKLASATEVNTQSAMQPSGIISSQKHDQTAGLHKCWKKYGTITIETSTVHTGGQSIKMTPNNASKKLESSGPSGGFKVAVANGATVTPSVYIYKDGSYNGNQPRLIVKRNDALGITSDTVLATYASGASSWNAISGTTAAVTDDGTIEFVIDCDGTAGNIFIDSLTVS